MVTIVYWSGTGNTEAMANEIEAAAKGAGAEVEKCYLTIQPSTPSQVKTLFSSVAPQWAAKNWKKR